MRYDPDRRRTKIIATLGPASSDDAAVVRLIAAGVDVFRLNFSHGTHESHGEALARIRGAAERAGRVVAVMQDLGGPKIRTGPLSGGRALELHEGDRIRLAPGDFPGNAHRIATTFPELAGALHPGDRLLLDDGSVELEVGEIDGPEIVATVLNGGTLGERKGINVPGVQLPLKAMTTKDEADLAFGLAHGVDLVALSFVETAADLRRARDVMSARGGDTVPLVAKIERPAAVTHVQEILDHCDGVMIARGDLGLELPLERVPRVQKEITRLARARGLPVILATQVLESMRREPRPTRAEVSDAANAVDAGVDAIMLAGETAVGAHPVRAVDTLHAIITDAEAVPPDVEPITTGDPTGTGHGRALCEAAVTLARSGQADAIVAVTRGGKTARLLSALRPRVPVYAVTDNGSVARRLALFRGVVPVLCAIDGDLDAARRHVERDLVSRGRLRPDAVVVFVNVSPDLYRSDANFLDLQRLGPA